MTDISGNDRCYTCKLIGRDPCPWPTWCKPDKQGQQSFDFDKVMGKWPGDETTEELIKLLTK